VAFSGSELLPDARGAEGLVLSLTVIGGAAGGGLVLVIVSVIVALKLRARKADEFDPSGTKAKRPTLPEVTEDLNDGTVDFYGATEEHDDGEMSDL
jgi:hypothetical protein